MTVEQITAAAIALSGVAVTVLDRWAAHANARRIEAARAEAKARRILEALDRAEAGAEDIGRDPESIVPPPPEKEP